MNRSYYLLVVGILFASSSSILIRSAESHPLVTASYRMGIATLVMLVLTRLHHGNVCHTLSSAPWWPRIAAGVFLGIHFAAWMTSLSYTSVATSVLIVDSSPLLVVLLSYLFLGEHVSLKTIAGICVSIAGAAIIVYNDVASSVGYVGFVLAAIGAVGLACYLVIGRAMRKGMALMPYVSSVYGVSFLTIVCIALSQGMGLGPVCQRDLLLFILLALGPSCFGHTIYNHLMKEVPATLVSTAIIAEPVGASLLAAVFLHEIPDILTLIGGVCIMAGIVVVVRSMRTAI